jgi:hypothetical protein
MTETGGRCVTHFSPSFNAISAQLQRRVAEREDPMSRMTIPARRPEWLETEDHFVPSETATAGQWRAHQKRMPRDRDVDQFVRIANRLGLADDVPLLPRLRALANENVTSLPRKR